MHSTCLFPSIIRDTVLSHREEEEGKMEFVIPLICTESFDKMPLPAERNCECVYVKGNASATIFFGKLNFAIVLFHCDNDNTAPNTKDLLQCTHNVPYMVMHLVLLYLSFPPAPHYGCFKIYIVTTWLVLTIIIQTKQMLVYFRLR